MGLIQLAKDLKKYRASKGKGQIAPKVRDPTKAKKRKALPKNVKRNRGAK